MPHVIVEHSANLAQRMDIGELVHELHAAALRTGLAPLDALRTRAVATEIFMVADGDERNAYLAITVRLATGRTDEERQRLLDALVSTAMDQLGRGADDVAVSVELQDIDPRNRVNRNGIRERAESP